MRMRLGQAAGRAAAFSPAKSVMNAGLGSDSSSGSRDEVAELKRQVSDLTGAVNALVAQLNQKASAEHPANQKADQG